MVAVWPSMTKQVSSFDDISTTSSLASSTMSWAIGYLQCECHSEPCYLKQSVAGLDVGNLDAVELGLRLAHVADDERVLLLLRHRREAPTRHHPLAPLHHQAQARNPRTRFKFEQAQTLNQMTSSLRTALDISQVIVAVCPSFRR